jgi:hypothetical protein
MGDIIDTLEVFDELKQHFPEDQAHAISRVVKRAEESRLADLATKQDLKELDVKLEARIKEVEARLELRIVQIKSDTIKWVAGMLIAQAAIIIGGFFAVARLLLP